MNDADARCPQKIKTERMSQNVFLSGDVLAVVTVAACQTAAISFIFSCSTLENGEGYH